MSSDLLKCTICPKKPSFSDVSHLLTHIGSKGHLAHLHSLQVKSHQEVGASNKLAIYNQWYQDYQLAALLSERMQQKEQKRAVKKAASDQRMAESTNIGNRKPRRAQKSSEDLHINLAYPAKKRMPVTALRSVEAEDTNSTASRASSLYPVLTSSPPASFAEDIINDEEYVEDSIETVMRGCLGSPKLKGTQWPGMALFDAASEESKRKRNQRKDGSVLETLERNAALVQPTETVSSCLGIVLKHRHMDDLENDSPVEGEDIISDPTPKRRKTTLPRARRQNKAVGSRSSISTRRKGLNTPARLMSSSSTTRPGSLMPSSPAGNEGTGFKLILRRSHRKKKKTSVFTVYTDSSPSLGVDGSSEMMPPAYLDTSTMQPQLLFRQPPALKSQPEVYDPFQMIRDRLPTLGGLTDASDKKENHLDDSFNNTFSTHSRTTANPLYSHREEDRSVNDAFQSTYRSNPASFASMYAFNDEDVFMPTRNPLMLAMGRVPKREAGEEEDDFSGLPTYHRQPLFAP